MRGNALFISKILILMLWGIVLARSEPKCEVYSIIRFDSKAAVEAKSSSQSRKFDCLPRDVQLDEVVGHVRKGNGEIKVEEKLLEMKARCRNGKLVDPRRREIRFFRPSCWGNPPPDYLEIQKRENEELARLKRRYTVVVFQCNPMVQ